MLFTSFYRVIAVAIFMIISCHAINYNNNEYARKRCVRKLPAYLDICPDKMSQRDRNNFDYCINYACVRMNCVYAYDALDDSNNKNYNQYKNSCYEEFKKCVQLTITLI